jgi:hypothetical protein
MGNQTSELPQGDESSRPRPPIKGNSSSTLDQKFGKTNNWHCMSTSRAEIALLFVEAQKNFFPFSSFASFILLYSSVSNHLSLFDPLRSWQLEYYSESSTTR